MGEYHNRWNEDAGLPEAILFRMYPKEPFTDPVREQKALEDIRWMLKFVKEGLAHDNLLIVEHLIAWMKKLFAGLSIDPEHVDLLLSATKAELHDRYHNETLDAYLKSIQGNVEMDIDRLMQDNPYQPDQQAYLNALLTSDRRGAEQIVMAMVNRGVAIEDIYLNVFQETLRHIGLLWHTGEIHVGREHYATSVTQYIMSSLYPYIFGNTNKSKRLLAAAVGSELHQIGIRMVADLFELDGWDTDFLGSNTPPGDLVAFAKEQRPDVIALSITMPYHLSDLNQTIAQIRNESSLQDTKIMVGGLPFLMNPDLFASTGADLLASSAKEGVAQANALFG